MARLTIRLVRNAVTGKREVAVAYESDPDALFVEHEEEHRALVEKLVGSLKGGAIEVERGGAALPVEAPVDEAPAEAREKLRQ